MSYSQTWAVLLHTDRPYDITTAILVTQGRAKDPTSEAWSDFLYSDGTCELIGCP